MKDDHRTPYVTLHFPNMREMNNSTMNITVPKQMCYNCGTVYDAFLIDDELWDLVDDKLKDKFLCPECARRAIGKNRKG